MSSWYGIDEKLVHEYARLVVRIGVNVQPGQDVMISCPVEHYEFARLLVSEAYAAGAGEVIMRWTDQTASREFFLHASDEAVATVPGWQKDYFDYYSRRGACYISVDAEDPEGLAGVDPGRMQIHQTAMNIATEEHYRRMMSSEVAWTVAAIPEKNWARRMFPDLPEEEAMRRLWELILASVYVDGGDAVQNWKEHDKFLKLKCEKLNSYDFEKLRYRNSLGTDFTIGLIPGHIWECGSEQSGTGAVFEANMPTEEIFTMPDRYVAEGTVVSSMPLSSRGQLIRDIHLTFHDGQVTDCSASAGEDVLKTILDTDEGSRRLGEVALVPCDSPIAQMDTLFYSTLFDENASCHLALGQCYPTTVRGGTQMSEEELVKAGGNVNSRVHVDFMIGTDDMSVTGIQKDGTEIPVFINGKWA